MSCKVREELPEAQVQDPGVEIINGGKGFSILAYNPKAEVQYINIYRQDVTDKTKPDAPINVGLIYTDQYHQHGWEFQDYFVYSERKYKYKIKYTTTDGIYQSNWSEAFSVDNAYANDGTVSFKFTIPDTSYFEYDEDDYTITLRGDNILATGIPKDILDDEDVKTCLVVSNGKDKKTYPFRDSDPTTKDTLETSSVMWLRSIVEPEFTDVEISIEGVIFEKVKYGEAPEGESTKPIRNVAWGELSDKILLKDKAGQERTKITIRSTTADGGYDYSD